MRNKSLVPLALLVLGIILVISSFSSPGPTQAQSPSNATQYDRPSGNVLDRPSGGTLVPIPIPIGGPTYDVPGSAPAGGSPSSGSPSKSGTDVFSKPSQSSPPNSIGGFNFGTGGGTAAGSKSSGGLSGLAGGTGSGTAAGGKSSGGFSAPQAPSIGGGKSFGGKR